ncbi:MAG TPA: hypothetical protein VHS99_09560 [Chloroflexota bacterium]|nr:hypothetical protein [Chloroflexota bacterium]
MIVRLLEAFFRYKWLVLLPPVLIPLIVGPIALLRVPSYYLAGAGIWVDRSVYLNTNDGFNAYLTPAQNQANRLVDLLRTRSLIISIASRTSLAPLVGSQAGEDAIERIFWRGLKISPSGERLLAIHFQASSPELAFQMVNAVIESTKERMAADRLNQANTAISFYDAQLRSAQDELDRANEDLRRYLAANPRLTTPDPYAGGSSSAATRLGVPASAIDPQLADFLRRVNIQQGDVNRLRSALEQARIESAAALEGQELGFQVVDPPRMPDRIIRERRRALIYPIGGLLAGMGISAAILVLLVAADRAARSESDLAGVARVAGAVPRLRVPNLSRGAGPEATRRAIGFAAGSLLPTTGGAR